MTLTHFAILCLGVAVIILTVANVLTNMSIRNLNRAIRHLSDSNRLTIRALRHIQEDK